MREDTGRTLEDIYGLLWSIGDRFDEMDRTGRNLWQNIRDTEKRIRELAGSLPGSGAGGQVRGRIENTDYIHLWWGNLVDLIEEITEIRRKR